MKGTTLLLTAALAVSGCAADPGNLPGSSAALVEASTSVRDFCYELPREEVKARIVDLLGKCYGAVETAIPIGAVYEPIKAGFQVTNERVPDGNRYSVRNPAGFTFSAEVLAGDEYCETRVHMYAINGFWEKTLTAVDQAVNGQQAACP